MKINWSKNSESGVRITKTVIWLCVPLTICYICFQIMFMVKPVIIQGQGLILDSRASLATITQDVDETLYSYRSMAVNINRYWIRDFETKRQMTDATLKTFRTANEKIAETMDNLNTEIVPLIQEARATLSDSRGAIRDTRTMIQNTDRSINQDVLPEVTCLINDFNFRTMANIEAEFHSFIGDPAMQGDLKNIIHQGSLMSEDFARISKSSADMLDETRKRFIEPSGWQRFWNYAKAAIYVTGEIITPWSISSKVQRFKMVE